MRAADGQAGASQSPIFSGLLSERVDAIRSLALGRAVGRKPSALAHRRNDAPVAQQSQFLWTVVVAVADGSLGTASRMYSERCCYIRSSHCCWASRSACALRNSAGFNRAGIRTDSVVTLLRVAIAGVVSELYPEYATQAWFDDGGKMVYTAEANQLTVERY